MRIGTAPLPFHISKYIPDIRHAMYTRTSDYDSRQSDILPVKSLTSAQRRGHKFSPDCVLQDVGVEMFPVPSI